MAWNTPLLPLKSPTLMTINQYKTSERLTNGLKPFPPQCIVHFLVPSPERTVCTVLDLKDAFLSLSLPQPVSPYSPLNGQTQRRTQGRVDLDMTVPGVQKTLPRSLMKHSARTWVSTDRSTLTSAYYNMWVIF